LYALHVRSSIARERMFQAEYMLAGMRNEVLGLACVRHLLPHLQARGFDELPADLKGITFARCYPSSLEPTELHRAFRATMDALLDEIRLTDTSLAARIEATLIDIASERFAMLNQSPANQEGTAK